MVHRLYVAAETACRQPSRKRHQSLKESEQQRHAQRDRHDIPAHDDTADNRDSETVHGKSHGKKEDIKETHYVRQIYVYCLRDCEKIKVLPRFARAVLMQTEEKGACLRFPVSAYRDTKVAKLSEGYNNRDEKSKAGFMIAPSARPEHGSQLPPASYDRMRSQSRKTRRRMLRHTVKTK